MLHYPEVALGRACEKGYHIPALDYFYIGTYRY